MCFMCPSEEPELRYEPTTAHPYKFDGIERAAIVALAIIIAGVAFVSFLP